MSGTILRVPDWAARTGCPVSTYYARAAAGLLPRPFKLGPRSSGLFDYEADEINAARASGASDDEIRVLVEQLHLKRQRARPKPEASDTEPLSGLASVPAASTSRLKSASIELPA